MVLPESKKERNEAIDKVKDSRVGTWISLGVVGAVILMTYFVLYGLYMARV